MIKQIYYLSFPFWLLFLIVNLLLGSCSGGEKETVIPPDEPVQSNPTETMTPQVVVATIKPSPTPFVCQDYQQTIILLIQEEYLALLTIPLVQFAQDLCQDQYLVRIKTANFDTPEQIRSYLSDMFFGEPSDNLIGAILIGDIPYAYQQIAVKFNSPDIPPRIQEFISLQYYSDLDGEFLLSDEYQPVNGQAPLGEPIFDTHLGETDWEIWISVMPPYQGDQELTLDALLRYFEKNHAYRMGEIDLPRTYIQIQGYQSSTEEEYNEFIEACLSGTLNWTDLKGEGEPQIYFGNEAMNLTDTEGYQAISEGKADFSIVIDHGHPGAVGQITLPWLEENQLATIFFWSHSCSVGDLDNPYVILNQILYHPNSQVLFASGNTTEAGGFGTNETGSYPTNLASALNQGLSIGEAILNHVNTPLVSHDARNPDLAFAPKIFYGDLTLKLRD
jgi:hypothetical protein